MVRGPPSATRCVDFTDISDIPSNIRVAKPSGGGLCVRQHNGPLLEYLRNRAFLQKLTGSRVRIWWPPTDEESKTDFSGRYWPAKVVRTNPASLVLTVTYDNGETENVKHDSVQPCSPFEYGGGIAAAGELGDFNVDGRLVKKLRDTTQEERQEIGEVKQLRGSKERQKTIPTSSRTKRGGRWTGDRKKSIRQRTTSRPCAREKSTNTPNKSPCTGRSTLSPKYPSSSFTSSGTVCSSLPGFYQRCVRKWPTSVEVELLGVEASQHVGNLLWRGELCEFRDPDEHQGTDPSDFVGVVVSVENEEPLYRIYYLYHDEDGICPVASRDIRRAVVVRWEDWREWLLLRERRKAQFYTTTNSVTNDGDDPSLPPVPPFEYIRPLADVSLASIRNPLPRSSPMLMKLLDQFEFKRFFCTPDRPCHPKIELSQARRQLKELPKSALLGELFQLQSELLDYKHQARKATATELECHKLRVVLDEAKAKINDLEAELNCMVCFTRRIDCVLKPCMHFSFCHECVKSLTSCPLCRRSISSTIGLSRSL